MGALMSPWYSPPDGWAHGLRFLYMTSWCFMSNLCMTIFPHERRRTISRRDRREFFSCSEIKSVKIQKNAQFLFCGKRKAFSKENWLQWLRPSVFHGRAFVLFWNATKTAKFIKNFQVHISHNGQINYTFKRKLVYLSMFYRCFIHFDL